MLSLQMGKVMGNVEKKGLWLYAPTQIDDRSMQKTGAITGESYDHGSSN